MAKVYREQARREGLLRTLEEKAADNPGLRNNLDAVLYPVAGPGIPMMGQACLTICRRSARLGFAIKFFFPKWSAIGYAP